MSISKLSLPLERIFDELFEQVSTLILHYDDGVLTATASYRSQDRRQTVCCDHITGVLEVLVGNHRVKRCSGCRLDKLPDRFPRDRNRRDGRNNYCRECEAERRGQRRQRLAG